MANMLRIAVFQPAPIAGDPHANADALLAARQRHGDADLIVTPALMLDGGDLGDLATITDFQAQLADALRALREASRDGGPAMLVGNSAHGATLLENGQMQPVAPGSFAFRGADLALQLAGKAVENSGHLVVQMAHQPYPATEPASASGPRLVVHRAGAHDTHIFRGNSHAINADGRVVAALPCWEEASACWHWQDGHFAPDAIAPAESPEEEVYHAMLVALRSYVAANHFPGVLLGLSGGLDSALTAAIATDALGADKVWCVMLPSRYTSTESLEDAKNCAAMLGVRLDTIPIAPGVAAMDSMLQPLFAGRAPDLAEENLQARLRMVALMGLSNKFGHMLMATSNKSEVAVGYGTLYGDAAGGYNVLKDLYKTDAFRIARWRNHNRPRLGLGPRGAVMPERIITKPPSAELRDNQRDDDSLPPYDVLDPVIEAMLAGESAAAVAARGLTDETTAQRIARLLQRAEYKRQQAPPGPVLSHHPFSARHMPITNAFRSD